MQAVSANASVTSITFSSSQEDRAFVLKAPPLPRAFSPFFPCVQVNLKAHHVEYNHFYIPDITSMVDIQEDYLKWFLSKAQIVSLV